MSKQPPKRELTLDLSSVPSEKKTKLVPHLLTSPDVQMLKLTSPQLAEFLSRNPSLSTPTPSGGYQFPTTVSAEQEVFVKGFEEALKKQHAADKGENKQQPVSLPRSSTVLSEPDNPAVGSACYRRQSGGVMRTTDSSLPTVIRSAVTPAPLPQPQPLPAMSVSAGATTSSASEFSTSSRPSSSASGSYDSCSNNDFLPTTIKQEPLDASAVPSPSGRGGRPTTGGGTRAKRSSNAANLSPINMESQEVIKLERKRLRNRLAASKCRKKKLERISNLDEKVTDLKEQNVELSAIVTRLKESVCNLKQEVMNHVQNGCQITM